MKSWVKKSIEKRKKFYKKHPEVEARRIANIRKTCRSKKERKEMSAIMKKVYKGKNTQKQMYIDHPELRKKLSKIKKLQYASNPEYRKKTSLAMKKVFREHPDIKKQFKKNFYKWLSTHPESFMNSKGNPNPLDTKTLRGDFVRSTYEAKVADTLFMNKIKYEYETRPLKFEKEGKFAVPDFYLQKYKLYIEVLGGYPGSEVKKRWKKKIYKKYKIKCIFLTPKNILNLNKNLLQKLS
ncbi:MAG: hypothetical protein ABIE22_02870 [archaeon]